jgi:hypothetical protein
VSAPVGRLLARRASGRWRTGGFRWPAIDIGWVTQAG